MTMNGPGRPTKLQVRARRLALVHHFAVSSLASEAVVQAFMAKFHMSESSVRSDLEALKREFDPTREPDKLDTDTLIRRYRRAKTIEALLGCDKDLFGGVLSGRIDPTVGRTLKEISTECRQKVKTVREERARAAFAALSPMTLDEFEEYLAWRKSRAPKPLGPGESVPPPVAPTEVAPPPAPPEGTAPSGPTPPSDTTTTSHTPGGAP